MEDIQIWLAIFALALFTALAVWRTWSELPDYSRRRVTRAVRRQRRSRRSAR